MCTTNLLGGRTARDFCRIMRATLGDDGVAVYNCPCCNVELVTARPADPVHRGTNCIACRAPLELYVQPDGHAEPRPV